MTDPVIQNPTWYADIRYFFSEIDIKHMRSFGLELGTYEGVKTHASNIYAQVSAKHMPPGDPWSDNKIKSFLNWMINNYPMGTAPTTNLLATTNTAPATRIRKEVRELSDAEVTNLIKAFKGILGKDTSDPNSYFVQAGYHWFPGPNLYCQHHVNNYNPWHRAYLHSFENALRSVPGCENVTLPYWDFGNTSEFPELFTKEPFASYTLPEAVSANYQKGYTTSRFAVSHILEGFKNQVQPQTLFALKQKTWELFNGFNAQGYYGIIGGHDDGHVTTGPTMADQGVAAFDPIFWFFHANWDRLWWKWQQEMQATTLETFISTVTDASNLAFFQVPALEILPPFEQKTTEVIDLVANLDTDYQHPASETLTTEKALRFFGSLPATNAISIDVDNTSVRVKGINRLKIPGSFIIRLQKNGEDIAWKGFFQPAEPETCTNCSANALINMDFRLPISKVEGGKLGIVIEPMDKEMTGDRISLKAVGDPTIHARLLVTDE